MQLLFIMITFLIKSLKRVILSRTVWTTKVYDWLSKNLNLRKTSYHIQIKYLK